MNLGRLRTPRLRERPVLLLLPLLALRLMVPAGFMPSFGSDLELSMQICHGDGRAAEILQVPPQAPAPDGGPQASHDAPCLFAATATVAPPTLPVPAPVASLPRITPQPVAAAPRVIPSSHHRPQSARAPPLHA